MKLSFLDRQMEKMSKLYDDSWFNIEPLPEPDEFGQVKLPYQKLRKLIRERSENSYAKGFFLGVSCALLDSKSKK